MCKLKDRQSEIDNFRKRAENIDWKRNKNKTIEKIKLKTIKFVIWNIAKRFIFMDSHAWNLACDQVIEKLYKQ